MHVVFHVNKALLKAKSPVFRELLLGKCDTEVREGRLEISDFPPTVVQLFECSFDERCPFLFSFSDASSTEGLLPDQASSIRVRFIYMFVSLVLRFICKMCWYKLIRTKITVFFQNVTLF